MTRTSIGALQRVPKSGNGQARTRHRRQDRRRYQLVLREPEKCRNSSDRPGGLSHSNPVNGVATLQFAAIATVALLLMVPRSCSVMPTVPAGASAGTTTLICVTPGNPGAPPTYETPAAAPPTETCGAAMGIRSSGLTIPHPVPKTSIVSPCRAGFAAEMTVPLVCAAASGPPGVPSSVKSPAPQKPTSNLDGAEAVWPRTTVTDCANSAGRTKLICVGET